MRRIFLKGLPIITKGPGILANYKGRLRFFKSKAGISL